LLLKALNYDHIYKLNTDHAPHTLEEKRKPYFQSMSGAPIVQFSLNIMIDFYQRGLISLNKLVEKMCHNPAVLYGMNKRGFIRQGYFADLVIVDLNGQTEVTKDTVLSKCGWSPLEGTTFKSKITHTFVNGHLVYHNGKFDESVKGQALKRYKV
jgi:dihydroorotase